MTPRSKRRLVVLALALGLIAAAPQMYRFVIDQGPYEFRIDRLSAGARGRAYYDPDLGYTSRVVQVWLWEWSAEYNSARFHSGLVWMSGTFPYAVYPYSMPPESITLRVACAVALAGVWGLVAGGQLLARRWTRKVP